MRPLCLLAALLCAPAPLRADDDNWPAFRGGARAGVAAGQALPSEWGPKKNVRWVADVPGAGWSSPVVWGGKVFVTSCVSADEQAEPRKGLYITDLQGKSPPGKHAWNLHCFDARTGKELWKRAAFTGEAKHTVHIKNSLASETPVADARHVVAYFGNVGVACFDHGGKLLWSHATPAYKTRFGWGTAASPALHDGKLFLVHDNEEKSFVQALDVKTGKEVWKVARKEGSNWATPFVWKHDGRTELVTAGSDAVRSYALDGALLWELKGMSNISIPTPFAAGGLLYVTSGYVMDLIRRPVFAIKPGAKGDISLKGTESSNAHIAWHQRFAGPYHPTPVAYGGYLYVLLDRGTLSCYDAKTGQVVYEKKRLGPGAFTASPWAYGGKVFCLSEDGETVVVQAGKEFKVLGRNKLGEMALATPALAGGSLFVRTRTKLYCLREAGK